MKGEESTKKKFTSLDLQIPKMQKICQESFRSKGIITKFSFGGKRLNQPFPEAKTGKVYEKSAVLVGAAPGDYFCGQLILAHHAAIIRRREKLGWFYAANFPKNKCPLFFWAKKTNHHCRSELL